MISRYDDRIVAKNKNKLYKNFFKNRGIRYVRQYMTPNLSYPTVRQISNLEVLGRAWSVGDKFYKLAHEYYGDSRLWWVIAWFNKKPTEAHMEIGEVVYIPLPVDKILTYLDI